MADPDGSSTVSFGGAGALRFEREESPACARLLAAFQETRRGYD